MLRKKILVATFLAGIAIVCASASKSWADDEADKALQSKLLGDWQVDVERTKKELKEKAELDDEEIEEFTARLANMRLSFLKEMRLVILFQDDDERKLTGKTKIQESKAEEKVLKLLVTPEAENSPRETVFTITFLEDGYDIIVVAAGDEPPLTLKRAKPDKKAEDGQDDAK